MNTENKTIVVSKNRSKLGAVTLGLLAALGISAASAASIGGIKDSGLGGSSSVVSSCDSDGISTVWVPEWSESLNDYAATTLEVHDIDKACDGWQVRVMVTNPDGKPLFESSSTSISPTSMKVELSKDLPASEVAGIDVVFFRA